MSGKRSIIEQEQSEDAAMEYSLSEGVDVLPSFDAMGLKEDLLRGIYAYGRGRLPVTVMYAM
jgi:hypothetical protein